jgi:hypothetical protein
VVPAVPEVGQRKFDAAGYADHLLTVVCGAAPALLHAEAGPEERVAWRLRPLESGPEADRVVAEKPHRNHLRTVLARFGAAYMDGLLLGGHQSVLVEQDGRTFVVTFFVSNLARSGFWARIFASPEEKREATREARNG